MLLTNGDLYSFGEGSYGELGHGEQIYRQRKPSKLDGSWTGLRKISGGVMHSLALMESGKIYAWGLGKFGALGTGDHACVL